MRKKAHIAIREGKKIRNVYVMPEEKEEIKNIKKEQGLRSLRQAYEVWKEIKVIKEDVVEDNVEELDVRPGVLHEFEEGSLEDQLYKQSIEINDLKDENRGLRIEVATVEATNKVLEKELKRLRATHRNKRKTQNDQANQRRVNEYWPELAEELDDTRIY